MTETTGLPRWIVLPDGRRDAFDPEAIFRDLFRATVHAGYAEPFRARELADAVLHFLAESEPGERVGSDVVRDVAVKVTRELGHLSLAAALSDVDRRPETQGAPWNEDAYPPEIVAAEHCGLLTRGDIDDHCRLAGSVLEPRPPDGARDGPGMAEALEAAGTQTRHYVAIDSPEYLFSDAHAPEAIRAWLRALDEGMQRSGLCAVVNLNCRTPPPWAVTPTGGLFPHDAQERLARRRADASEAMLNELASQGRGRFRIDWHLNDSDFQPSQRERLLGVCRHVRDRGDYVALVMDRPRRPTPLAEGLDREYPAVFSVIGVRVDVLAWRLATAGRGSQEALIQAIPALASLARSAGNARLRLLRNVAGADVSRGFLLDRARLLVVPAGTLSAFQTPFCHRPDEALALQQLRRAILGGLSRFPSMGPPSVLDAAPPWSDFEGSTEVAPDEPPRNQLRRAAILHADTGTGTAVIRLTAEFLDDLENLADLVEYAYRLPGLVRVRFTSQRTVSPTPLGGSPSGE